MSKAISTCQDSVLLQQDLDKLSTWAMENNMELHPDKFVFLNFNCRSSRFHLLSQLPFYEENLCYSTPTNVLEPSPIVRDLGITFTPDLSWSTHVSVITKSARKKAGWALSIFRDRSPYVMLTLLYKSVVRSLLKYSYPVWSGLSIQETCDIEAIQRSFTNKIIVPFYVENY